MLEHGTGSLDDYGETQDAYPPGVPVGAVLDRVYRPLYNRVIDHAVRSAAPTVRVEQPGDEHHHPQPQIVR